MFPIIFDKFEESFTSNGLGRLTDCTKCVVTEERNGIFECEFQYPVSGRFYDDLINGAVIGVIHDDNHDIQPFDVYSYTAPINGLVTFYAHHISYRLNNIILQPFNATSAAQTMARIVPNSINRNPFTFWTDKSVSSNFGLAHPESVRAILFGQEGSILDVYGKGEYKFNKFEVLLYTNRGTDTGVTIRYGKNLVSINDNVDQSSICSAIAPYWVGSDNTVVYLPEVYVLSPNAPTNLFPWTNETANNITDNNGEDIYFNVQEIIPKPVDFSSDFVSEPTAAQLRARAYQYLADNQPWLPTENLTIDFAALWQTPEYEDVAVLQRVSLCDTVSIYYPELGVIAAEEKVIKVVYNVLLERFDSMEFGKLKTSLSQSIEQGVGDQIYEEVRSQLSYMDAVMLAAIEHATKEITGGLGGYVVMTMNADNQPQELLIMDTPDTMTAVNVWRFNSGGLGHSHSGYQGPYNDIALTQDGKINAAMITTGILNASLIRAGVIQDLANNNYWNLETGEFQLASTTKVGTSTVASVADVSSAVSTYDTSLNQQTIFNKLTNNGVTQGIYLQNGLLYINASYVQSGTLSADRIKGGTLEVGGVNNESGVIDILAADGTKNGGIDKNGIETYYFGTERYHDVDYEFTSVAQLSGANLIFSSDVCGVSLRINSTPFLENGNWFKASYVYMNNGLMMLEESTGTPPQLVLVISPDNTPHGQILSWYDLYTAGDLLVGGTKSRIAEADEYGKRLLYCYETPSPMFGDVGEGVIDEYGTCYVFLDPVFAETISTNQYQVFLQKYGQGECYIAERKSDYFVVVGEPGLAFGWELKAKQKDFDQLRLNREPVGIPKSYDYGGDAAEYYFSLEEGRIA